MEIPPPLPGVAANHILKYSFWLSLALITAMFLITLQRLEYPQSFENLAFMLVGGIIGALKLQTGSDK